jgi:hypothetical protein
MSGGISARLTPGGMFSQAPAKALGMAVVKIPHIPTIII